MDINNDCYFKNNNYDKYFEKFCELNINSENNDISLKQKENNNKKDYTKRKSKNIEFQKKYIVKKSKRKKCDYYKNKNNIEEKDIG